LGEKPLGKMRLGKPRAITTFIEEYQIVALKFLSKREAVSMSMLIRRALDRYLEEELPRYGLDLEQIRRQVLDAETKKVIEVTGK